MAKNQTNIPSGFGGLTRFNDEYQSKFNLNPSYVIVFIITIIAFRVFLGFFYGAS